MPLQEAAVYAFPDRRAAADRLARQLAAPLFEVNVHRFPDEELLVTIQPPARTCFLYISLDRPSDKLITLLFACEALRRQGAERIFLIAPYLCYMRQDQPFHPGEAISQRVIGQLLSNAVDGIITVDAHLHRTKHLDEVFSGISAINLSAADPIASAVLASGYGERLVVVGPDEESRPLISSLSSRLGVDWICGHKSRQADRRVEIIMPDASAVSGRPVLLVDDIASSGTTLKVCADTLRAAGATSVDVIVVHALFPIGELTEFANHGIRSIRSTNSVPHPTNAIGLEALLGTALRGEISRAGGTS